MAVRRLGRSTTEDILNSTATHLKGIHRKGIHLRATATRPLTGADMADMADMEVIHQVVTMVVDTLSADKEEVWVLEAVQLSVSVPGYWVELSWPKAWTMTMVEAATMEVVMMVAESRRSETEA